ncbi:MAG: ATP-binding cassette domain-containing protein [Defluviitaleaceae bacterium]|nr:ATP-binding cassette domain-containing protein [Defluviitaleaceae bacterium]
MSLLKVENMTHSFGDNVLLRNISFDLFDKEKMGLVGLNGCGKSTLLKILTNEIIHEGGNVAWRPKVSIGYLDQQRDIPAGLAIRQYLQMAFAPLYAIEARYFELNTKIEASPDMKLIEQASDLGQQLVDKGFYELDTHIDRVAAGLGVTPLGMDKEVAKLSGGQRAKVILAKLLLESPDVLIMDEPTNFLDKPHIEWLSGFLRAFEGAFIVVSHHFGFLDGITNCICEIEFESVEKYKGNLTAYLGAKNMRQQQYIKNYAAQQKWIEKTEDYIARNKARASTARQAKSRIKMLAKVDRLSAPKANPVPNFRFPCAWLGNGPMLEVENLIIGYDYPLLSEISFKLNWGAKIAITGFNGIGKTTLVKTLLGEQPPLSGGYSFHERVAIGYFRQEYVWEETLTPYSYIAAIFPSMERKEIFAILAKAGIGGQHFMQPLGTLSGGEQAKVRLCSLGLTPYNLLVFDEPTNHLDVTAKEKLKNSLIEYPGSLIVISHEKSFCDGLVDDVLDVEKRLR